jgi:hypothetical protein
MTNWRRILQAVLEAKTGDGDRIALAVLHKGTMTLIDNAAFPRDAIDLALNEAYAMGMLPARHKLPVPMKLARAMRWGDWGFFTLSLCS